MSTVAEINGWITIREAALDVLGVTPQRVHQLIAAYDLQTMEINARMKMVRKAEIQKLAASERPSGVHLDRRAKPAKPKRKRPA